MNRGLPFRAVILCHNEAINLPRCLAPLKRCREMVVVDDGSTDGSVELARQAGATVLQHPFTSFAGQRNWAMDRLAEQEAGWLLHLDADEEMTDAGLDELAAAISSWSPEQTGWIPRQVLLEGRWLKHCTEYPVPIARVLHTCGPRFTMKGHGEVLPAPVKHRVYLEEPMKHHAFSHGWAAWWAKHEGYAEAEARRLVEEVPGIPWADLGAPDPARRRAAWRALSYHLPGRPALRFVYAYLVRGGFRDGHPGWTYCRALWGYERRINHHRKHLSCTSR